MNHSLIPNELFGDRFQIEREVGRGAAGIVYRAYDQQTAVTVALKVLAARGNDAAEDSRFEREASLLAQLSHPNIVRVVAAGSLDDGTPFLAMEWLEGEDLSSRQRRAPLTLQEALEISRQVALALDAAHAKGIVHRDVKPSNIFLVKSGEQLNAKLVDFGVAANGDVRLTQHGNIVGTPAYMAPEQARGDAPIDHRCDLYALGATLFELVAGRPPHVGPTPIATLARLVTTPAPRLSEFVPQVPRSLDDLIARLLASSPQDRPPNALGVAEELEQLANEPAVSVQLRSPSSEIPSSISLGSGSRLVTSLMAILPNTNVRNEALAFLASHGADGVPLGQEGLVGHLGARQALGDEAVRGVDLGCHLAKLGASVGVATGRTRMQYTRPVGEVVDRATSLAREAKRGTILADATTTELARGRFELQVRPDGSSVVGAPATARRPEAASGGAPFVGREAELAQVMGAYDRCSEDETPVIASVSGPPGIGKTRLRREVLQRVAASPNPPKLAVVRCEPFGQSHALGTASEVLRSMLGVSKGLTAEASAQAIDARLGGTVRGAADPARDVVARLVANEPFPDQPGARDALWLSMTDIMVRLCSVNSVGVVIEDVQWADPESVGWLDHLLGRAAGRPLWYFLLARPAFWKDFPKAFSGRDHVRIDLRPISRRAARSIARAVLGEKGTDEVLDWIASQAGGSPLFAEELSRLAATGRDATKAPTLEAAIQASVDALDEPLRDAIARLSVLGGFGWESALSALGVETAPERLRQLAAHEMVVEQAESRFDNEREWAFKHALVRDVVYASIDAQGKKKLHAAAAEWFDAMGEDSATVARHYELGGEEARAATHWESAARRALATNALADAVNMAERALAFANDTEQAFDRALLLDEAYSRLDARSADRETSVRALAENVFDEASEVRAAGARARFEDARGGGEHITDQLAEVCARASALGIADEEARCRAALAFRLAYAGRTHDAEDAARSLLALTETKSLPTAAIDAWQTLAIVRQTRGELASALDARRRAARVAASAGLKEREAALTINVGFALTTVGARQEARSAIEQGISIALTVGSQGTVRLGRMLLLGWSATFGVEPSLDSALAELRSEADSAANNPWFAADRSTLGVLFYRGMELLRQGGTEAAARALPLLRMSAEAYRSTQMLDVLPVALGLWSEAERRVGNADRALEIAREAAELVEGGAPCLLNEAPVYLALHDVLADSDPNQAREAIVHAVSPLLKRLRGLGGSPYALSFLTGLPHNSALLSIADSYGLVPREIEAVLERAAVLQRAPTMPAPIAPLVGFALGVLLAWAAGGRSQSPSISLNSPGFLVVFLYSIVVFAPAAGYFLAYLPDWTFAYLFDPRSVPSVALLGLLLIDVLAVLAGFALASPKVRPGQPLLVLPYLMVPLAVAALIVAGLGRKLAVYASYPQARRGGDLPPLAGSPAGYATLLFGVCLLAGTAWTVRELRRMR